MKNKVIIYSGGMDSTVLLYKHAEEIALAISFDYGSKHNDMEFSYAKKNTEKLGIKHIRLSLPFVNEYFKSDLLKSGNDIPEGHYEDVSMKRTVVPFRNGIMLSIAAGIAESIGCNVVLIANHGGDHFIYKDCRDEFIKSMSQSISLGTDAEVTLEAPYTFYTKRDIALEGKEIGVDFALNYSCYNGEETHCGKCVAEDTEVLMSDYSKKKIQDIIIGDTILSYDRTKKLIISNKVLNVHSNGYQTVYNAKFGEDIIKCTSSHKIARYNSSRNVEFSTIEKFPSYKYKNAFVIPFWKELNPIDLKSFWTGWLSGVIEGDDGISTPKNWPNERFLSIPVKELKFAELIKEVAEKYFNVDMRFQAHKTSSIIKENSEMINVCCSITKNVLEIENQIKTYSENLDFWKGWLRGIIDTNGGIDHSTYRIYQSKPLMVSKIRSCLQKLELSFTEFIKTKEKHNNSTNKLHANYDAYTFILSNGHLTNVKTGNIKTFKYKDFNFLLKFLNYPIFDSLKEYKKVPTYDLTTEIGNYFADGFLIHNCGTCVERKEALFGFDPTLYKE